MYSPQQNLMQQAKGGLLIYPITTLRSITEAENLT